MIVTVSYVCGGYKHFKWVLLIYLHLSSFNFFCSVVSFSFFCGWRIQALSCNTIAHLVWLLLLLLKAYGEAPQPGPLPCPQRLQTWTCDPELLHFQSAPSHDYQSF